MNMLDDHVRELYYGNVAAQWRHVARLRCSAVILSAFACGEAMSCLLTCGYPHKSWWIAEAVCWGTLVMSWGVSWHARRLASRIPPM